MPPGAGHVDSGAARVDLWRWILWFGVLSGFAEALMLMVARFAMKRLISLDPEVVWMAPAANVGVFAVIAAGLQVGRLWVDRSTAVVVAVTAFVFLLLLGPVLLVPTLHPFAKILLTAGVAVQATRVIRARIGLLDGVIRRTLPWVVGLCAALGFGWHPSRGAAEWSAEVSLPTAAPGAPNVLLIVLDTVPAQRLGLYGYQRPTSPRLDEFAKTGVVFDRAFSTSPWTLPSHASFFTGKLPNQLSADWLTPLDETFPTLAETFAARGYETVGFTGNLLYTIDATGLNRGFIRYRDFPISTSVWLYHSWLARALFAPFTGIIDDPRRLPRKRASQVNEQFLRWLGSRPRRPFFAFLNYFDAHGPYMPPMPYDTMFGTAGPVPALTEQHLSEQDRRRVSDAYDGLLVYLDQQFGVLLETLRAQGVLDTTVVVVTADHGEQFGEHGLFSHGNSLYRSLLHVPLVISYPPEAPSGLHVRHPVTLVNLPATILDLAGMDEDLPIPGSSLKEYWQEPVHTESQPLFAELRQGINIAPPERASRGPMYSLIVGGMHYIRNDDGREELYDLEHDVAESNDLARRREATPVIEEARRALAAVLARP